MLDLYALFSQYISIAITSDDKLHQTVNQNSNHYGDSFDSYSSKTYSAQKFLKSLSKPFHEFDNFLTQQNKDSTASIIILMKFTLLTISVLCLSSY